MGLVNKASTLFKGLRRHRNDGRISRFSKELEVKSTACRKEETPRVVAPEPRRLHMRSGRAGAIARSREADTMAQTTSFPQKNHDKASHTAYNYSTVQATQPIQLVEDDEDDLDEEEAFDDYEEEEDTIDDSVAEDMKKLEESFKGISQQYRLINRIGEGKLHQSLHILSSGINRVQEHSLQFTRPSNYFTKRTSMTMRMTWSRMLILTRHPQSEEGCLGSAANHGHPKRESLSLLPSRRSMSHPRLIALPTSLSFSMPSAIRHISARS